MARDNPEWSLWTNGFCKFDLTGYPKAVDQLKIHWVHEADCGRTFDSITFGDGSGLHSFARATIRCGFGCVSASRFVEGRFETRTGALGPIPGDQSVPVAELCSLLIYLRYAAPHRKKYHFITDCAYVSNGWWNGRQAMTNGWSVNAGLWREACRLGEEIGMGLIRVMKTRAHQSTTAFPVGSKERFMIMANAHADVLAKAGANKQPFDLAWYKDVKFACGKLRSFATTLHRQEFKSLTRIRRESWNGCM